MIALLLATPPPEVPPEAEDLLSLLDISPWERFFAGLQGMEAWQSPTRLIHALLEGELSGEQLLLSLRSRCTAGIQGAWGLFLLALMVGALGAVCSLLFEEGQGVLGRLLSFSLGAVLLGRLLPLIEECLTALNRMQTLTEISVPLVSGILLLLGSPRSAGLLGALGEGMLVQILGLFRHWVVPLVAAGGVLRAVDAAGGSIVSGLADLAFLVARWLMRLSATGYLLLVALLGSGALMQDGLLLKMGRAAAGSLPMVGLILSDSLGAAVGCLRLVKGALGWTGVLLILWQVAAPGAALLLHGFALRAAAAFLLPLQQRDMGTLLLSVGEMLTSLGAVLFASAALTAVSLGALSGCWGGGG